MDISKSKKELQHNKNIPNSEKWQKIPELERELLDSIEDQIEIIKDRIAESIFLLHVARLSFHITLSSKQFFPPDFFIPRPEFRLIERKSLMSMHQMRDKGVIDKWGLLFNSKKKFRQYFTTGILNELVKEGLIILLKEKSSSGWDSVFLTTLGWLTAVKLEFLKREDPHKFCENETFLSANIFKSYFNTESPASQKLFEIIRGSDFQKFTSYFSQFCPERTVFLSRPNDGSSRFLEEFCKRSQNNLALYIDVSLLSFPMMHPFQDLVMTSIEHSNLSLPLKDRVYFEIGNIKDETNLVDWFGSIIKIFQGILDEGSVITVFDHADLFFHHPNLFPQEIKRLLASVFKEDHQSIKKIIGLKTLPSIILPSSSYYSLPPISYEAIFEILTYERRRHLFYPHLTAENTSDLILPEGLINHFYNLESDLGSPLPMNTLITFGGKVIEKKGQLKTPHLGLDFVTSKSDLKRILEEPPTSFLFSWIHDQYLADSIKIGCKFPSPRSVYRFWIEVNDEWLELFSQSQKHSQIMTVFLTVKGKFAKLNSDFNLNLLNRCLADLKFSEEEETIIESLEQFHSLYKVWETSLFLPSVPNIETFESFFAKIQTITENSTKLQSLNLDHLSEGVVLAILQGFQPDETIIEIVSPYLKETLMKTLSLLQSSNLPVHEKQQLLQTFSVNLFMTTQRSKILKEKAGSIVECYFHLPSTYSYDLFQQALVWSFPLKEKMFSLIDFLLAQEAGLLNYLLSEINLQNSFKSNLGVDFEKVNDGFLTTFIIRFINRVGNHRLLLRIFDDVLQGLIAVEGDVLQSFKELLRTHAPILFPLFELLVPIDDRKKLFGSNEFFLTPLFLVSFSKHVTSIEEALHRNPPKIGSKKDLFLTLLDVYTAIRDQNYGSFLLMELEHVIYPSVSLRNFLQDKRIGLLLLGEYAYSYGMSVDEIWELKISKITYKKILLEQIKIAWGASETGYSRLAQFIRRLYMDYLKDKKVEIWIHEFHDILVHYFSIIQYYENAFSLVTNAIIPNSFDQTLQFCEALTDHLGNWMPFSVLGAIGFIIGKVSLFDEFEREIFGLFEKDRAPKPLVQSLVYFKPVFLKITSELKLTSEKLLSRHLSDFIFLLGLVGSPIEETETKKIENVVIGGTKVLDLAKSIINRKFKTFEGIIYLTDRLKLLVLANILFSSQTSELVQIFSKRSEAILIIDLVNEMWAGKGVPSGFLVAFYYRLFDTLIYSISQKYEKASISILTIFTHGFSEWRIHNPSDIVHSIFSTMNDENQSKLNSLIIKGFHQSFSNAQQLFSQLNEYERSKLIKFIIGQEWYIRDLFSIFLDV